MVKIKECRDYLLQFSLSKVLLFLIIICHSFFVYRSAVDIPFWDEWEVYGNNALSSVGVHLDWIFLPHNEHTIAISKLLFILLQKLNILNYTFLVLLSWCLYVGFILFLLRYSFETFPKKFSNYLAFYFIFLFSTILYENHSWGFQICFHFALIFQFLAIYLSINKGTQGKFYFFILGLLILSCYSLPIGIPMSLSTILCLSLYLAAKDSSFGFLNCLLSFLKTLLKFLLPLLFSLSYWFYNFQLVHHNNHGLIQSLLKFNFWTFFISLNGLAFGYNDKHVYWWFGLIPFCLFCFSLVVTLRSQNKNKASFVWIFFGLSLLAALGTIAIGRHSFGPHQALSSRYSEIALLLIPVIANLLFPYLEKSNTHFHRYFFIFGFILFFGFLDDWDFSHYTDIEKHKTTGLVCLEKIYKDPNPSSYFCPTIYPYPAAIQFLNAKKLKIGFTQNIK